MKCRTSRPRPGGLFVFLVFGVCGNVGSYAQMPPEPSSPSGVTTSADKDTIIEDLRRRVEALERKLETKGGEPTPSRSPDARGTRSDPAAGNRQASASAEEPADEETTRALERALIREGGLVLPPKSLEIEPRLVYDYRSSNALQIVNIGGQPQIGRQDLKRDTATASIAVRAGLPASTQLDAVVPYSISNERRVTSGGLDESDKSSGFGAFEIGVTRQLLNETKSAPGLLGTLRWRDRSSREDFGSPTAIGSNFRSIQAAVIAVKRVDPMVFFGSLSHAFNHSRNISGSVVDPGNSTGIKLGSILAVSPQTSVRLGFELSRSAETRVNGSRVAGSDDVVALYTTGFSFVLSPRVLLGIDAGIGLTSSSPDFRLGLSLPVRF
jgi:hypothetical protein